jgi:group II intron reverse transcriptase/maturase
MPDRLYVGLGKHETTSLWGIAKRAQACKHHRFQNLYRLLDESLLLECWSSLNKKAASGVDGVTAAQYGENLAENIRRLAQRLKTKSYRTKLVRRVYIPKGKGNERPLGIPALEDKLVQLCCARILTSIYEQEFLPLSYGYRPGRSARNAVEDLGFNLQYGSYGYAVEADIKGYFDNIDHDRLLEMLKQRIDDDAFLGLIRQWLKAGILEIDGEVIHPETGSPQGGIVSPILANVYLHHVVDQWFDQVVKERSGGKVMLIRYADDYVCMFQFWADAKRFNRVMPKRLRKYGLEISPEKSGLRRLSRFSPGLHNRIEFLSMEFYWRPDYHGEMRLMKRTSPKRLQAAIAKIKEWIKENRHLRGRHFVVGLNRRLNGHYNYFGIKSNERAVRRFYNEAIESAYKWLNRRGGKKNSFNWRSFTKALKRLQVSTPRLFNSSREHVVYN